MKKKQSTQTIFAKGFGPGGKQKKRQGIKTKHKEIFARGFGSGERKKQNQSNLSKWTKSKARKQFSRRASARGEKQEANQRAR